MAENAIRTIKEKIKQKHQEIEELNNEIEILQKTLAILGSTASAELTEVPRKSHRHERATIAEIAEEVIRKAKKPLEIDEIINQISARGMYKRESARIGVYRAATVGRLLQTARKTFSLPELNESSVVDSIMEKKGTGKIARLLEKTDK